MLIVEKAKTVILYIKNSIFITAVSNNIKRQGLRLKFLLDSVLYQRLTVTLAAFLISRSIFISINLVLASTLSITMLVKIIKKNIIGDRFFSSIKKHFYTLIKNKNKVKNLKPININYYMVDYYMLGNILSYLPAKELQNLGMGQLLYILKKGNIINKNKGIVNIGLKKFVVSNVYKHILNQSFDSILMVLTGRLHTAVLTEQGRVYVCGLNYYGQLGLGDTQNRNRLEEMPIENIEGKVVSVILGIDNTAVLTDEGKVYVCGSNRYGQLGLGDNVNRNRLEEMNLRNIEGKVVSVTLGGDHTAVLTDKGNVYVCGRNIYGQLGLGDNLNKNILVEIPLDNIEGKAVSVTLGAHNTSVLTDKGKVYVCGNNYKGQLGLGDNLNRNILVEIPLDNIEGKAVSVTLGALNTSVQTDKGKVYVCGRNSCGQLGLGDNVNRNRLEEMNLRNIEGKVVSVSLGDYHTSVLTEEGKVYVCGSNSYGQLGLGDNNNRNILVETPLDNIEGKIVSVFLEASHTTVKTDQGKVYVCGNNVEGQLGLGDYNDRNILVEMPTRIISGTKDALDHAYKVNNTYKVAARKIIKKLKEVVLRRRLAVEAKSNNLLSSPVIARALRSWVGKYKDKRDLNQVNVARQDQEESFDQKVVAKIGFN